MTKAEAEWLDSLSTVADECGLDYEDTAPKFVAKQGWDEARECRTKGVCSCSADAHIHMLTEAFDLGLTPEETQMLAVKTGIWTKWEEM